MPDTDPISLSWIASVFAALVVSGVGIWLRAVGSSIGDIQKGQSLLLAELREFKGKADSKLDDHDHKLEKLDDRVDEMYRHLPH